MSNPYWTDQKIADLRTLWRDGLSCSRIAMHLGGGVTRNAVIGKVHRLGLAPRPAPFGPAAKRATSPKRRAPSPLKPYVPPPAPVAAGVKILDLEPTHCRWPVGDPKDPDFHFCGAPRFGEASYCEHHCTRAYNVVAAGTFRAWTPQYKRDHRAGLVGRPAA